MSPNPIFRIRLKHLMVALGISQNRFATLIGVTPAALSQILAGKRNPNLETLDKLHMATGVSIDYLIGRKLGQEE